MYSLKIVSSSGGSVRVSSSGGSVRVSSSGGSVRVKECWNCFYLSCLQLKEALDTSYREKDKLQNTLQITQDRSMTRINELKEVCCLHHSLSYTLKCSHARARACMHTHKDMHTCTHTHTYTQTCMHTHPTHTCTHTQTFCSLV